jgi:hypothetical protein
MRSLTKTKEKPAATNSGQIYELKKNTTKTKTIHKEIDLL